MIEAQARRLELDSASLHPRHAIGISIVLSFIAMAIWLVSILTKQSAVVLYAASGMGATAAGLACWAACQRYQNVALWAFAFGTGFLHFLPHLTSYGRRGMLSICLAMLWAAYHQALWKFGRTWIFMAVTLIVFPFTIAIAAFSEARVTWPETIGEAIDNLRKADIAKGLERLTSLQGSTDVSMWCIENYPNIFDSRPFGTIVAVAVYPIPREIWAGKPDGLGKAVPRLSGMQGYGGLNLGAGLIGHIAAEGKWPCLFLYAFLFGLTIAYCDRFNASISDPLSFIPMGCALGELYAFARGELSFFAVIFATSTISSFLICRVLKRVLLQRSVGIPLNSATGLQGSR